MKKFVQSVQQPKPLPSKRSYASFLDESIDKHPSSPTLKKYRPEAVDNFVIQWVESISGSESYRERHCRSDSLFDHSDGDLISRRLTKSAPNMGSIRDADGFVVPPTSAQPVGTFDATSSTGGSGRSSGTRLVENPLYRDMNLAENNVYFRHPCEQFPDHIASLVEYVGGDRDSPGPSLDQVRQDTNLYDLGMGSAEPDVEKYFQANIFPNPKSSDGLKRTDRLPMAKRAVPDVGSNLKVSGPMPDMLYGYNRNGAFPQQQAQLRSMGNEMVANSQGLIYPFFVIEFKGDGPSGDGSLWVATNQCLGGSVSCVNIAECLNRQLRQCNNKEIKPIDSCAFSIAMNGTEARLYISWKHDELNYYMRSVESFLLQKPNDYVAFRKYVRNIIDWGKDKRLKEIRDSLDSLLEESRKTASQQAKSRPSPSDDSVSSRGHKRKDSRKGKTSDHNQVSDAIQDSQSSHYQSYEGSNPPAQQPLSSDYEHSLSDASRPVTSSYGYSSTDAPQPVTSNEYNPDTSHAQIYDPLDAPTYSIPPYSSEDVSPPLESHEDVNDLNTRGHRTTRQSRSQTDNSKARKTRKRY